MYRNKGNKEPLFIPIASEDRILQWDSSLIGNKEGIYGLQGKSKDLNAFRDMKLVMELAKPSDLYCILEGESLIRRPCWSNPHIQSVFSINFQRAEVDRVV